MKDKFEEAIRKNGGYLGMGEVPDFAQQYVNLKEAAKSCNTLHQQALLKAKKKALIEGVKMGIEAATSIIKKINKEL